MKDQCILVLQDTSLDDHFGASRMSDRETKSMSLTDLDSFFLTKAQKSLKTPMVRIQMSCCQRGKMHLAINTESTGTGSRVGGRMDMKMCLIKTI